MADMSQKEIEQVSANDYYEQAYTAPANGQKFLVYKMWGSSCYCTDVKVEVFWGTDRLFVTHGDLTDEWQHNLTGDGSTQMKIRLTNDSSASETIMCAFFAVEVG